MSAVASIPQLLVQLPTEDADQVLLPFRVVEIAGTRWVAAPGDEPVGVEPGTNLTVYYTLDGEFVKQPATIVGANEAYPEAYDLELHGDPVSAEQRGSFRVSCVGCDIVATMGSEEGCTVVDVSATGFGVYAQPGLRIGDIVDVALHCDGECHTGQGAVQSVRKLADGARYGVTVVSGTDRSALLKALPRINASVQRQQLRRLA